MTTSIDLHPPYSNDYRAGYLNTNKEPRRVVALVRNDGTKTSTSYARYLMSCELGRYLNKDEHVDHIDGDRLNDVISNLQLLSQADNNRKQVKQSGRGTVLVGLTCPVCSKKFQREPRLVNCKISKGKTPTCSRSCGGRLSHITKKLNMQINSTKINL
jgi:hypothetical protein